MYGKANPCHGTQTSIARILCIMALVLISLPGVMRPAGAQIAFRTPGSTSDDRTGSANTVTSINNTEEITKSGDAISVTSGNLYVTNSGTITSTAGDAIHQNDATASTVVNNTGTIQATVSGTEKTAIYIKGSGTVENAGQITSSEGKGIYFKTSGVENKVVNKKGGAISGGTIGIVSDYELTVENTGTITSSGTGIRAGSGTVTNGGTIASSEGKGIYFSTPGAENKVVNTGDGTISGKTSAIEYDPGDKTVTGSRLTVENAGQITSSENGIVAWREGTILAVTNTGSISADQNGIKFGGSYATVDNYGSITGDTTSGVWLTEGKIVNHTGSKIYLTDSGADSSAILFAGYGEVENSGEIKGTGGIHFGVDGKVTNNAGGTITGTGGWGIIFGNSGTLINHGTIEGATGVAFNMYNTGNDTLANSGTIIGTKSHAVIMKTGNDILDNSGTIIGTGGDDHNMAVSMGAGDDTVYLRSGSDITGSVDADDSTDATVVSGTGDKIYLTGSGTITGGTLLNFETIEKSGAGTFTLGDGLSSGNHISVLGGAIRANGAFTHEAGATYTVGADADGNLGKISAETATIKSGSVEVDTATGTRGGTHTILETDSGLTGTYGSLSATTNSDYIAAALSYDANNAYITLTSNFAGAALTQNQQAVATSLDETYSTASGDMLNVYGAISTLSVPAIRLAYDQMGGASHTAFAAIDVYRVASFYRNLFRRTLSSPSGTSVTGTYLPALFAANTAVTSDAVSVPSVKTEGRKDGPFLLWIRGYGASGNRDGDDIASRYDFTIGGTVAGIEYRVGPAIRAGAAFGYSRTDVDMKDLQDSGNEDSYQGSLYSSWTSADKRWYVDAALGYSMNKYNMKRSLSFGTISRTSKGSYNGSDLSGYAESGYLLPFKGMSVTPYVSFLALKSRRDGFTESGADALNLIGDSARTTSLQGSLGIGLAKEFAIGKRFFLTPEVSARWVHEFGDTNAVLNASFAGAPSGSFTVSSDTWDRDSGVFSLGLTGGNGDAWSLFFAYEARMRSKEFAHSATGGVRLRW